MVENKVIVRVGLLALIVPGLLLAAPYYLDWRSKIRIVSLPVPHVFYPLVIAVAGLAPLASGGWLFGRWFLGKRNGEGRRPEYLILAILDLLTLPLLAVAWLFLSLTAFGFEIPLM